MSRLPAWLLRCGTGWMTRLGPPPGPARMRWASLPYLHPAPGTPGMVRLDPPCPAIRGGELCPQPAALSSRGDASSVHRLARAQSPLSGSGCCQCSLVSLWPQEGLRQGYRPELCAHRPLQQAHFLCLNLDLICAKGHRTPELAGTEVACSCGSVSVPQGSVGGC